MLEGRQLHKFKKRQEKRGTVPMNAERFAAAKEAGMVDGTWDGEVYHATLTDNGAAAAKKLKRNPKTGIIT